MRMRIAHVAPYGIHPYSGGRAIFELATTLAGSGSEVELWQLHEWDEHATRSLSEDLVAAGVTLVRIPCAGPALRLGSAAKDAIQSRPVDVAHLHGVFSPQNNLVARHLNVPFVHSPHGGYAPESLEYHRVRKVFFQYLYELPMLRRARFLCALTETEAKEIRNFGVRTPIETIPHGVTPPPPEIDGNSFRRELGVGPDELLAIYVGRLDVRGKRLDAVVDALSGAPEWRLALVGSDYRGGANELRRLIEDRGLTSRAHMTGPRRGNGLHEALAASNLLVLLSRSEGLPMALLEGMSHGVPAAVSPEVNARVAVATSGWVTNPDELGTLLRRIAGNPYAELARRQNEAHALATRFEWPRVAAAYLEIYRRAVGRRAG